MVLQNDCKDTSNQTQGRFWGTFCSFLHLMARCQRSSPDEAARRNLELTVRQVHMSAARNNRCKLALANSEGVRKIANRAGWNEGLQAVLHSMEPRHSCGQTPLWAELEKEHLDGPEVISIFGGTSCGQMIGSGIDASKACEVL